MRPASMKADDRREPTRFDLRRAARADEGDAFGEFYRPHRALVLAFLGRRAGNPEVAADLLAETFAAALVSILDADRGIPDEPLRG